MEGAVISAVVILVTLIRKLKQRWNSTACEIFATETTMSKSNYLNMLLNVRLGHAISKNLNM